MLDIVRVCLSFEVLVSCLVLTGLYSLSQGSGWVRGFIFALLLFDDQEILSGCYYLCICSACFAVDRLRYFFAG